MGKDSEGLRCVSENGPKGGRQGRAPHLATSLGPLSDVLPQRRLEVNERITLELKKVIERRTLATALEVTLDLPELPV